MRSTLSPRFSGILFALLLALATATAIAIAIAVWVDSVGGSPASPGVADAQRGTITSGPMEASRS